MTISSNMHRNAAVAMVPVVHAPGMEAKPEWTRQYWTRELEALLRVYEPTRVHCAPELLAAYDGLERELVQCYRHYYTGAGGFRVASTSTESATFSLPREAIDTYLRLQLRARRSNSFASKGDGVRDVEIATASPTRAAPRQRATSASAVRMY